ncbi:MAG: 50S ribosomal protein L20 [Candidatus Gottesmanbacteria bacterium]
MRIKRAVTSHAKHKKIFEANKGYRMTKRRLIKVAKEAYLHAGEYAFAGRKNKKRDFRATWISRISHAVVIKGMSYSKFMHAVKQANIVIDRKIMAHLIVNKPEAFDAIVDKVKIVN